ncbi:MAG TPA: PASTA domain-containing protein, partial [Nitriliruptorales bacterium]
LDHAVPGGPVTVDLRDGSHHTVILPVDATDTIIRAREAAPAATPTSAATAARQPHSTKRRRLVTLLSVLATLAAAGAAAWAFLLAPVTDLPSIVGLAEDDARAQLEAAGFQATVLSSEHSLEVVAGRVVRHEPEDAARKGATIGLVLSDGPRPVEVPDISGRPRDDAVDVLTEAGLEPVVTDVFSEEVDEGAVVRTIPGGGETVAEASEVTVEVSLGRQPIEVPDVRTKQADAALEQLRELGLDPVIIEDVFSDDVPEGHVVEQSVEPGTTRFSGDQIQLKVSKGARTFPMPQVVGEQEAVAKRTLEDVGLVVEVERVGSFLRPRGQVARTDPDADEPVRRGQTVTIFVWD